jgi:peptide/nickel transport system substrate-binding protein
MYWVVNVVAAALLAAVAFSSSRAADAEKVLSIGMYNDFNGFNLVKTKVMTPATLIVADSMLEGLFAYDYKLEKIVPRLGLNFKEADDRMSATVSLRPNVTFHDGTPFDAKAVVFHYSRMLDPANGMGYNRTVYAALDRVEEVDPRTVRFVLKKPWPSLQSALAIDYSINLIGSPKALQEDPDGFNRHPVGTGPFAFVSWQSGDRLVVERNKTYWEPDLPKVDRVVFRILPDGNTRYASLNSGEIDIMSTDNIAQVIQAKHVSGLRVLRYDGASAYGFIFNTSKPPLDDVRVRSAIVQSFDGAALVEGFLQGQGSLAHDFFPNSPWSCEGLSWKAYDPKKAEELIKSVGKPIKVTLTGFTTPAGRRLASIAQQFMASVGIQVQIQMIEPSQSGGKVATGDFEMMQWRFTDVGGEPDIRFGLVNFTASRYTNPEMSELLEKARTENSEKRRDIYCQVSQILSDDAVLLIPGHDPDFLIVRDTLVDLPPNHNNAIGVREAVVR